MQKITQKITTCLWFDDRAEEAAAFYTSLFAGSRVVEREYYGEAGPGTPGTVMTVVFELAGQRFMALNGGPEFTFDEAISLHVDCADQEEVDEMWNALCADGGRPVQCGWVTDKFGLSWQIVPTALHRMLADPDRERSQRVMRAMLGMRKLDVQGLVDAYEADSTTSRTGSGS